MPRWVSGTNQLRDVAKDLRRAGNPARGLSRKMRRNIVIAAGPIKKQVQQNARALPSRGVPSGHEHHLRQALAQATRISVTPFSKRTAQVRLIVDGKKMPINQRTLPPYMEGSTGHRVMRWRHPVYGPHSSPTWRGQDSHPFVAPAVTSHMAGVITGVMLAVDETADELLLRR